MLVSRQLLVRGSVGGVDHHAIVRIVVGAAIVVAALAQRAKRCTTAIPEYCR